MIIVIGKENCSQCHMVQGLLNKKNIPYEYKLISSFSETEQQDLINLAKKNNKMSMPLIIKDGQLITLQEV